MWNVKGEYGIETSVIIYIIEIFYKIIGCALERKDKTMKMLIYFLFLPFYATNLYLYKPFCKDVKVCDNASLLGGNTLPGIIAYLTKAIFLNIQMSIGTNL